MAEYEEVKLSEEFIHLCEAQLRLLLQNFLVQESIIYLTISSTNSQTPKLIPILVYPHSNSSPSSEVNSLSLLPPKSINKKFNDVINDSSFPDEIITNIPHSSSPYQLILPLIYQDLVLGLLAIKRKNLPWQETEILQIKDIAQTITLARIIEQKQQLSQIKLTQLEKLNILKNNHLDDFLHQLRNPLTAIRTFAKLLLKRLLPHDSNYQISENIIRESDRMKDLMADFQEQWEGFNPKEIISLNATPSASFFLPEKIEILEKFDIKEIINPLITTIKAISQEKNIELLTKINEPLLLVYSNKKALTEIIYNLLENAVKYNSNNGKILLEVKESLSTIIIEISDTGYGISEEEQQHIFERNYRGIQNKNLIEGTGLGLNIVKNLCDKINIKITLISPYNWIENQSDKGSQFTLFIPIDK